MPDTITRLRNALEAADARLADAVADGDVIEGDLDWQRMADQVDELELAYYDACEQVGR